jgi:hypothetical protein
MIWMLLWGDQFPIKEKPQLNAEARSISSEMGVSFPLHLFTSD